MLIRSFLLFLCSLFPAQALALSCMELDIAWSYQFYDEAKESYGVFAGTLTPEGLIPDVPSYDETSDSLDGAEHSATYGLEGLQMFADQNRSIDLTSIEVRLQCSGPWCPGFPQRLEQVLAFIEVDDAGAPATLHIGACGGSLFDDTPENRAQVQACMRGEACIPKY